MLWSRNLGLRCPSQLGSGSISQRTIFSFFRKKKTDTTEKGTSYNPADFSGPKNEETHADLIWTEAKKDFEKNKLSKLKQSERGVVLKRSQIKQIKKAAFLDVIELYKQRSGKSRRGFNEFIQAALVQMTDYEVADDLEVYKALLGVLPRGRLKATTFLHADMGAFKRQQDTVSKLLMQLNANHVLPDDEVGGQIVDVFGFKSYTMTHYRRMMYWVPKLRHANPWPVLDKLPDDLADNSAQLARLVAARICPDPNTEFTTIDIDLERPQKENLEKDEVPWCLVSGQSETQRALLSAYASSPDGGGSANQRVLYLDGPHTVWFRQLQVAYYTLWADLDSKRLQHQLELEKKKADELIRLDDDSWNYRVYGSDREKPVLMQPVNYAYHDSGTPESASTNSSLMLKPKRDSLMCSDATIRLRKKAQWSALSQGHHLTHLPEQLTRHEQAEGSIFALGVVGPVGNALANQITVSEWQASRGTRGDQEGIPQSLPPNDLPMVPAPAPPLLLRNWLKDLRVRNPALDGATIVMRAQTGTAPSPVEDIVQEVEEDQRGETRQT